MNNCTHPKEHERIRQGKTVCIWCGRVREAE